MLRLGVMKVLNTLPIHFGILEGKVKLQCELIEGRVTELNEKLNQGFLDLSVVSSFEYLQNPEQYRILPDLGVSCFGPVRSIYLFSQVPLEALAGQEIGLTAHSLTSVNLVQYLLKDLRPQYRFHTESPTRAFLLIADEAIRRFYSQQDAFVYDLGELWQRQTGLPFVFALWVVREEVYQSHAAEVHLIHRGLLESKALARSLFSEMAAKHYGQAFLRESDCLAYLQNLHYGLDDFFQQGLLRFMEEMKKLGKLATTAPLRILPA